MGVDRRPARGPYSKADLDVREEQLHVTKPRILLVCKDILVAVEAPVIGNAERLHHGRSHLDPLEVLIPNVRTFELVVKGRARCMDVRIPSSPDRTATNR